MKKILIGAGLVVVAGGAAIGALPSVVEGQIKTSLDAFIDDLPVGEEIEYGGYNYDLWAGILKFDEVTINWDGSGQNSFDTSELGAGQVTFEDLTLREKSLSPLDVVLSGLSGGIDTLLLDGDIAGFKINLPKHNLDHSAEAIQFGGLSLTGLSSSNRFDFEEQFHLGKVTLSNQVGKASFALGTGEKFDLSWNIPTQALTGIAGQSIASSEVKNVSGTVEAVLAVNEPINLDVSYENMMVQNLSLKPVVEINFAEIESYAKKWPTQKQYYDTLVQLLSELGGEKKGMFQYVSYENALLEGLKLSGIFADVVEVSASIESFSGQGVTPLVAQSMQLTDLRLNMSEIIPQGDKPNLNLSIDTLSSVDVDISQMLVKVKEVLAMGEVEANKRLVETGWAQFVPVFNMGDNTVSGLSFTDEDGQSVKWDKLNYKISATEDGLLSYGGEASGLEFDLSLLAQMNPEAYETLSNFVDEKVKLDSVISISYHPEKGEFGLETFNFGVQDLGKLALSGNFADIYLNSIENPDLTSTTLVDAQVDYTDWGLIAAGKNLLSKRNGFDAFTTDIMLKGILDGAKQSYGSPEIQALFTNIKAIAMSEGALTLKMNPESKTSVIELAQQAQFMDFDGLAKKLALDSSYTAAQ
ncbi:MAG: hypothetical protein R3261_06005 [Alphaproteobacteria bacterium]|nr:hypothetical protein [Alphaproteobacteria bacterium]